MKLKNKKTGETIIFTGTEIHDGRVFFRLEDERGTFKREINSLDELNAEWEDYDKPKKHYEILAMGAVMEQEDAEDEIFRNQGQREIGNYFETKEEAEKAVERLRTWKRLKDKGFVFKGINMDGSIKTGLSKGVSLDDCVEFYEDMELLFGGEE